MQDTLAITFLALALGVPALAADNPRVLDNKILRKSVIVDCSIDTVWWKWTTHEGLKTFFGQENRISLAIGGPFEIYFAMTAPEGERGSEGCRVISYLPKEMFSFSWNAPPSIPDIRNGDHNTWVVVTFKTLKGNKTEVNLSHAGWLEGKEWDRVYDYFDKAWPRVLESLQYSCKRK